MPRIRGSADTARLQPIRSVYHEQLQNTGHGPRRRHMSHLRRRSRHHRKGRPVIIDSKTQYVAACNTVKPCWSTKISQMYCCHRWRTRREVKYSTAATTEPRSSPANRRPTGILHGIPGLHPVRQGRRRHRRSHRPHQHIRIPSHRLHHNRRRGLRRQIHGAGRFGRSLPELLHQIRRRIQLRLRRRSGHQHRQAPRPRTGGTRRPGNIQIQAGRRRSDRRRLRQRQVANSTSGISRDFLQRTLRRL